MQIAKYDRIFITILEVFGAYIIAIYKNGGSVTLHQDVAQCAYSAKGDLHH